MARMSVIYILHGWAIDQNNDQKWLPFMKDLERFGFVVEFLKLPGLSSPLNEVWTLDNYVDWVLSQIGSKKDVILIGHSFGGQIGVRLAALHPKKVTKLILIDSAGIRDHSLLPTLKRNAFWAMAKVGKILLPLSFMRTTLYKLARERDYVNAPPLLKRTMSTILDQEVISDLAEVVCPTLIIWGELDTVTPLKLAHIFNQRIAQSKLHIIPKARHSPQFTHKEQTVAPIVEFLND